MLPATKAKELIESFISGNFSRVVKEFKAMTPLQAASTAAYCMNYLPTEAAARAMNNAPRQGRMNIGNFLRLLIEQC